MGALGSVTAVLAPARQCRPRLAVKATCGRRGAARARRTRPSRPGRSAAAAAAVPDEATAPKVRSATRTRRTRSRSMAASARRRWQPHAGWPTRRMGSPRTSGGPSFRPRNRKQQTGGRRRRSPTHRFWSTRHLALHDGRERRPAGARPRRLDRSPQLAAPRGRAGRVLTDRRLRPPRPSRSRRAGDGPRSVHEDDLAALIEALGLGPTHLAGTLTAPRSRSAWRLTARSWSPA